MVSVFDPEYPIHQTFDLKGSLQGRKRKGNEKIGKDVDWMTANELLLVAPKVRAQLSAAHERDVSFLTYFGVMDYSILVGIHDPDPHSPSVASVGRRSSIGSYFEPPSRKLVASRKSVAGSDGSWADGHGGIIPAAGSRRVYFVGIIDFLIWYGIRKMGETLGRAITGHEMDASCVDPLSYARRQVSFVREHVLPKPADGELWGTVGTLRVTFIEAFDLIGADMLNKSDPYGVVQLGFQRQRTRTIQNDNNPKWHEDLYVAVHEEHLRQNIELSVWDCDDKAVQGDDDFLGKLVILVRSVGQTAHALEIVEPLQGVSKGRLSVKLELFSSDRSDVAAPPPMPAQHE
ncbi:unnamed protein product [Prorocentrum cordatum]|uniref:C2 domain-containing protein n=1 Tax=Prorocentrum cordatum TaxID=2364126 RepID=A0ABN9VS86_9DINO|nr:unnamed protein product [Polarella glacialis]